jgi:hypothetical protein
MGAAGSVPDVDAGALRSELDAKRAEGFSDQQLLVHMTAFYQTLVKPAAKEPVMAISRSASTIGVESRRGSASARSYAKPWVENAKLHSNSEPATEITSKLASLDDVASPPRPRRRRSVVGTHKPAEAAASTEDQLRPLSPGPAEADQAAPEQVDSWESVTAQPMCLTCGMAFSSEAKKENHVKFSSLHASMAAAAVPPAAAAMAAPTVSDASAAVPAAAAAAADVTAVAPPLLIYSGSKLFWRTTTEVQIFLLHHVAAGVIEVLGFSENAVAMGRLLASHAKALALLNEESLTLEIQRMAAYVRRQSLQVTDIALEADVRRKALVSAILARIGLSIPAAGSSSSSSEIEFTGLDGDELALKAHGSLTIAADAAAEAALVTEPTVSNGWKMPSVTRRSSVGAVDEALAAVDAGAADLKKARRASASASIKLTEAVDTVEKATQELAAAAAAAAGTAIGSATATAETTAIAG